MAQQYHRRLRNERFQQTSRGKPVVELPGFGTRAKAAGITDAHKDQIDDLIERIERGDLLPEDRYRHGVCRDCDEMLDVDGIKHLHLGVPDDDKLLLAVEYPDKVVLLGVHDHSVFKGQPRGSVLHSLYEAHLHGHDKLSEESERTLRERIRDSLFRRRGKA
jgi:hypothetical protein